MVTVHGGVSFTEGWRGVLSGYNGQCTMALPLNGRCGGDSAITVVCLYFLYDYGIFWMIGRERVGK